MPHLVLWVQRDYNKPNKEQNTEFTDTDKYQVFIDGDTEKEAQSKFDQLSMQPTTDGIQIYMVHMALILESTEPHHATQRTTSKKRFYGNNI